MDGDFASSEVNTDGEIVNRMESFISEAAPSNPVPAMRTYQPVEHPVVVIGQQYLAQYYVELAVSANDSKGKRKLLTMHDRRFIKDAAGNTLVNLGKKERSLISRSKEGTASAPTLYFLEIPIP
ncbi:hypothetical protein OIU79_021621 [Salix purpurea]|uniref:Uncharacterized protein n=1 Tax=Salix purpurea TaxID=77065 RepID=A0A9Q0WGP4_SALPP|nr:hypothetical protein OIU79_021621 [Salix purpurea]